MRAEIQDVDQRSLVLSQAIKNIAREDLTRSNCSPALSGGQMAA